MDSSRCLVLSEEVAAGLARAAAGHGTTVGDLAEHVLKEYLRQERLSGLRSRSGQAGESGFTTWRDQVTFTLGGAGATELSESGS
ncbi:hypothetical protein ACFSSC_08165 [Corynebacterium mendelii]|uniref:Uncharacterized protein n=1 Tax=Corynebacterium mendelii TaxID=2765362 RepID=A0A939IYH9_9CORY|nr:hypothetical protein [Corynebacterium mendelii]MBN9644692.1 hypothetical protein [Corynebacterium mendelii]